MSKDPTSDSPKLLDWLQSDRAVKDQAPHQAPHTHVKIYTPVSPHQIMRPPAKRRLVQAERLGLLATPPGPPLPPPALAPQIACRSCKPMEVPESKRLKPPPETFWTLPGTSLKLLGIWFGPALKGFWNFPGLGTCAGLGCRGGARKRLQVVMISHYRKSASTSRKREEKTAQRRVYRAEEDGTALPECPGRGLSTPSVHNLNKCFRKARHRLQHRRFWQQERIDPVQM